MPFTSHKHCSQGCINIQVTAPAPQLLPDSQTRAATCQTSPRAEKRLQRKANVRNDSVLAADLESSLTRCLQLELALTEDSPTTSRGCYSDR